MKKTTLILSGLILSPSFVLATICTDIANTYNNQLCRLLTEFNTATSLSSPEEQNALKLAYVTQETGLESEMNATLTSAGCNSITNPDVNTDTGNNTETDNNTDTNTDTGNNTETNNNTNTDTDNNTETNNNTDNNNDDTVVNNPDDDSNQPDENPIIDDNNETVRGCHELLLHKAKELGYDGKNLTPVMAHNLQEFSRKRRCRFGRFNAYLRSPITPPHRPLSIPLGGRSMGSERRHHQ